MDSQLQRLAYLCLPSVGVTAESSFKCFFLMTFTSLSVCVHRMLWRECGGWKSAVLYCVCPQDGAQAISMEASSVTR